MPKDTKRRQIRCQKRRQKSLGIADAIIVPENHLTSWQANDPNLRSMICENLKEFLQSSWGPEKFGKVDFHPKHWIMPPQAHSPKMSLTLSADGDISNLKSDSKLE